MVDIADPRPFDMKLPARLLCSGILLAALNSHNAYAEMCSGSIVGTPVLMLRGENEVYSDYYKSGMQIFYITGVRYSSKGNSFFCSWGGDCISTKNLRLGNHLRAKGDPSKMSGAEIKASIYETTTSCSPNNLRKL